MILSIMTYPINYSWQNLRLLDIFSIVMFLIALPFVSIKKENLVIVSLFFVIFFFSILIGTFSVVEFDSKRLIFIYKYLYPFLLVLVFYNLNLNRFQLKTVVKYMFFTHMFLVIWVYVYIYMVSVDQIHGSFRPSFPFSNDMMTSDAHLYSATLAIGLIFFTMYYKYTRYSLVAFLIFLLFSLGSILLTGSRSGIIVFMLAMSIYMLLNKKRIIYFILSIVSLPLFFLGVNYFEMSLPVEYFRGLDRILSTDIFNDSSFLSRISKSLIGINDSKEAYFLLGIGSLHSTLVWYDSLIGILMSHTGLLGSIVFFLVLNKFRKNNNYLNSKNNEMKNNFLIILTSYIFINLITEFFLVARSVFPLLVYLFILHQFMKLEDFKLIKK